MTEPCFVCAGTGLTPDKICPWFRTECPDCDGTGRARPLVEPISETVAMIQRCGMRQAR